jgi:hypothetical protein
MKPQEVAARFVAFLWYTHYRPTPSQTEREEANRFARESWGAFLPVAHKGWGRLLLRIAKVRATARCHATAGNRPGKRQVAAAV